MAIKNLNFTSLLKALFPKRIGNCSCQGGSAKTPKGSNFSNPRLSEAKPWERNPLQDNDLEEVEPTLLGNRALLKNGIVILSMIVLLCGCRTTEPNIVRGNAKFNRLFCWGRPVNEENARRFALAGVTDIIVENRTQLDLALKYGMTPYWKCFHPAGPHRQVMSPEEEKFHDYINGKDLDSHLPSAERNMILHKRKIEKKHRYGGEMEADIDTLNGNIQCFISDTGLEMTKKRLDAILDLAPSEAKGMCLDYLGYMNHRGCYCDGCMAKYKEYLSSRKLPDSIDNQTSFYLEKLVEYYNDVIDYIKSRRPDYKIIVHIYPDFKNDPLYGNRTKADYCGQTVSWYFKWNPEKITKYTKFVVEHARDYHSNAEGIPFIGLSTDATSSLGSKTPEEVEQELRTILLAGGRTVMVCTGSAILEPGYFEAFRKYCGKVKDR
ncbi:MAG: hypothetical protein J6X55_09245 [Victivallales bacterium]|nr:hypothetical protein [Victivallales bacterium]